VFVHGLFSSSDTWDLLISLLESDNEISEAYDLKRFDYSSPKWKLKPTQRIPDFETVAGSLSTFLDVECASYENVVIIAHSQGGLIVQRFLSQMLTDGRGRDLARVSRVVLLACPNNGSEFFLALRRTLSGFWLHRQERELRPYVDNVTETLRRVLKDIVFATSISSDRCPIVFSVYVGESDNIVTLASARSVFPNWGALPGDHNSLLHVDSVRHRTFTTVKTNLLAALAVSGQSTSSTLAQDQVANLSADGSFRDRAPIMRVTATTTRSASTESHEIEFFDLAAADIFMRRRNIAFLPPDGEEVERDE
jgi:pimeloyl-ACP methyl ester carboxylesterase